MICVWLTLSFIFSSRTTLHLPISQYCSECRHHEVCARELIPPQTHIQAPQTEMWITTNQWSFYQIFRRSIPLHKRKVPYRRVLLQRFWLQYKTERSVTLVRLQLIKLVELQPRFLLKIKKFKNKNLKVKEACKSLEALFRSFGGLFQAEKIL